LIKDYGYNLSTVVAAPITKTFDTTAGLISTLTCTNASPGKISPMPFLFTFNKAIDATTFTVADDIDVTNGVPSTLVGSGSAYTLTVLPGEGLVTVAFKSTASIKDTTNATVTVSGSTVGVHTLSKTYDSTPPRVLSLNSAVAVSGATNRTTIPCSLVFSETVTGLATTSFQAFNSTVTNLAGSGSAYTFDLAVTSPGVDTKPVKVVLIAAKVKDVVLTDNNTVAVFSRTYDGLKPTLTIPAPTIAASSAAATYCNTSFVLTVGGGDSKAVKLDVSKLTVVGGTIDSVTPAGSPYLTSITVNVTMPRGAGNVVTLSASPGLIIDDAGNKNDLTSQSATVPAGG